jgi:hypothetical protein
MNPKDHSLIVSTQAWLNTIIVEYSICPFAKRELDRGSVRLVASHDTDIENCLLNVILECERLNNDSGIETTLLIYGKAFTAFDDYLDFLGIAEALLIEQGYEGVYQLASFHPDYCFEGAKQDDPANYTNRSPYPLLHLLRETSIDRAIATHPNAENIPQRNIDLTRELGLAKMQALLAACYCVKTDH